MNDLADVFNLGDLFNLSDLVGSCLQAVSRPIAATMMRFEEADSAQTLKACAVSAPYLHPARRKL